MSEKNLNHEIKDDELANVTGGGCGDGNKDNTPVTPDTPKIPDSLFEVGDTIAYISDVVDLGQGKVLEKKYDGSIWRYKVELMGQQCYDVPENVLKKC